MGYEVFAGNTNHTQTLPEIVEAMQAKYGRAQRIWVFDRGIVGEENLPYLRERDGQSVVGRPQSMLGKLEQQLLETGGDQVQAGVEVKLCPSPDGEETFVLAKSRDRAAKEQAMHQRFVERIETGLTAIGKAAATGRLKDPEQAGRRIGRLLGQNSRAAGCFQVQVKLLEPPQGKLRLQIECSKQTAWQQWAGPSQGCYLLRSKLTGYSAAELRKMYMQLVAAEAYQAQYEHKDNFCMAA